MTRPIPLTVALALLLAPFPCHARIIMRGGVMIQAGQLIQQVEAIAASVDESAPNALALRDTAEENLVKLGDSALSPIQAAAERRTGLARDALAVAAFRLANDLTPQTLIIGWVQHKTDKPANITSAHIISDELLHLFPHHLIYGIAGAPTVLAVAADGKVQDISDDAALAKFLNNELPAEKGTLARSHAATAALSLAAARSARLVKSEDITKDITETTASASLAIGESTAHAELVFANDGAIATLKTTLELPPPTTTASPVPTTATAPSTTPG